MKRRSRIVLEQAIVRASSNQARALAHYELGVFHDNNSREEEAIPHYKKALLTGLDRKHEAMARAWLASSLYKVGKPKVALVECQKAQRLSKDSGLSKFLLGLERRISR
jgi:tetratricopeptide (TPR) repeat protein